MLRDIKVLYSKYKEPVKLEVWDDIVVLFNHNDISPRKDLGIFTGISLIKQEGVEFKVFDLDFNELKFIISQRYLYIDTYDSLCYNSPVCLLEFYPSKSFMGIEKFKPHMLERRV